ncbi:MAG: hypothetical protein HKO59_04465 [Phycisphaerales bacterium]|nr:hypothetical protein [Phycisphaerae bacterium]NNF43520.1 hypothetical protein [Phycisphaerales bacterium]NNM25230.1 hypothetical protein [Phycisphaerales bacterium]
MNDAETLWLTIDQGGHASRVIVYDPRGEPVATAAAPITTVRPGPDRVEHDGEEIVRSVRTTLDAVASTLGTDTRRVQAAGLATQRSSVIAWDRVSGTPLSPVLSWQDRRAAAWLAALPAHEPPIADTTGLVCSPHYGASKLRWLLDHVGSVQHAAAEGRLAFGPLASFLLHRLTRERPFLVDPANASRTLLCDWRTGTWASSLLTHFGIDPATLPQCVASRGDFGSLDHPDLGGVPVRVMTGDQSAAIFASGVPAPAQTLVNVGTGAFVQRLTQVPPDTAGGLLRSIVWRDDTVTHFALEGTVNGAGAAIDEVAAMVGVDPADAIRRLPAALDAATPPPLFLNGVGGLGSPYWRPDFTSRFIGEGATTERLAAVVESIAFLLAVNIGVIEATLGPTATLLVTGGGATLDGLLQRLADLTGRWVERPAEREATTRGLAFFLSQSRAWTASPVERFSPGSNPALHDRFARWQRELDAALADTGESESTPG